jgi:hypothetical protein
MCVCLSVCVALFFPIYCARFHAVCELFHCTPLVSRVCRVVAVSAVAAVGVVGVAVWVAAVVVAVAVVEGEVMVVTSTLAGGDDFSLPDSVRRLGR